MEMKTILDTSKVPAVLIIGNETEAPINLPIFPDNGSLTLQVGEQLIYKVASSREYLYYYTTCKSLGLSLAEQESE